MLLLRGGEQLRRGGLVDGMRVSQKPFSGGDLFLAGERELLHDFCCASLIKCVQGRKPIVRRKLDTMLLNLNSASLRAPSTRANCASNALMRPSAPLNWILASESWLFRFSKASSRLRRSSCALRSQRLLSSRLARYSFSLRRMSSSSSTYLRCRVDSSFLSMSLVASVSTTFCFWPNTYQNEKMYYFCFEHWCHLW